MAPAPIPPVAMVTTVGVIGTPGWCARRGGGRIDAEDVTHKVLLKVLFKLDTLRSPEAFPAWLFRVARTRCLADQRQSPNRDALREQAGVHLQPSATADPEQRLGETSRVHAAMAALPEAQRQLILLKQLGELSYREIAGLLGVAEGTIKSRLHAATQAFRRLLADGEPDKP